MAAFYFKALIAPAALAGAVLLLRKLTFGLSEANRDLSKWSGALAASFAQLDIAQMRSDIATANASAGTGANLNAALADVIREFQPIREDLANLMNIVGTGVAVHLKNLIALTKEVMATTPWLKKILEKIQKEAEEANKKNREAGFPGNAALGALAAGQFQDPAQLGRQDPFMDGNVARARGAFLEPVARPGQGPKLELQ